MSRPLLALVLLLAGCGGGGSGGAVLLVTVDSMGHVPAVSSLRVQVTQGGQRATPVTVPLTGGPSEIPPARSFSLEFPPDRSGDIAITVEALDSGGGSIAAGAGTAAIAPGRQSAVTIFLVGSALGDLGGDGSRTDGPDLASPDIAVPRDLLAPDLVAADLLKPSPPSCVGLPTACGPNQADDCCETMAVPGGSFSRSNDGSAMATVSPFRLDRYEVTVGRFRKMLAAGGPGTQVQPPADGAGANRMMGTGWNAASWNANLLPNGAALTPLLKCNARFTWTDMPGGNDNLAMSCITWYEAFAFCLWDGGRLPTEAEWAYAAAGGNEQRPYPWSKAVNDRTIDASYAVYDKAPLVFVGAKSPKGDGRWGHSDLAGGQFEWTFDWFGMSYPEPCVDCADLRQANFRAVRGGGAISPPSSLYSYARNVGTPSMRYDNTSFRCARSP